MCVFWLWGWLHFVPSEGHNYIFQVCKSERLVHTEPELYAAGLTLPIVLQVDKCNLRYDDIVLIVMSKYCIQFL